MRKSDGGRFRLPGGMGKYQRHQLRPITRVQGLGAARDRRLVSQHDLYFRRVEV